MTNIQKQAKQTTKLLAGVLFFANAGATHSQADTPCYAPEQIQTLRADLLVEINRTRQTHNLARLQENNALRRAAQRYSCHNANRGVISHRGSDGRYPPDRVEDVGYDFVFVGENLAVGFREPAAVVEGWMNSPSHRELLLHETPEDIGLGIAAENALRWHWTMKVGTKP